MANDVVSGPALVHELFREQARRTPDALAVDSRRGTLTYGELEARSNRLAHHLRSLGVGPEVRVAICAGRTPERLVAILAVLKAGGAYLSMDPEHPAERLAFQLEDARVPVVLTQEPWAGRLPAAIPTIDLERIGELAGSEESPPAVRVDPSNLAYVIYTSGSTGKPKGVEIPHAGLLNLVRWHQGFYEVTPEDRATLVTNPAFDASVWEMWPYLTAGASLHIPDEETRVSPPALAAWWEERGITLSFLPTPLAEAVMEAVPDLGPKSRLRALIAGGDRLHRRPAPGSRFLLGNHYGPSEYSVVTTAEPVPPDPEAEGLPSIGLPIDNTRVYVLDAEGEPVTAGEPGELYVAGIGLARGYLARPDLTAERFVPDPWSPEPGDRMYRTGDLARSLPDGRLDFLGRIDHQVKIRGFRVELGEIEAALESHPAVAANVVAALEGDSGTEKFLVAYVVPRPGTALPVPELREYLRKRLAEYMVPAHFVVMEALPLTPNGKVDRKALPRPDLSGARPGAVSPRTPLEAALAEIWSEVLGIPGIGVGEHFFELGGHSLLAARVIARVQESLGRRLTPRALFEAPTIELLAARLAELPGEEEVGEVVVATDGRWIPSVGQEGMWFADRLSPGVPVYTVVLGFDLAGPLDPGALHRALAGVVRRHEILRVTFSEMDGRPVLNPVDVAVGLPRVDLRALPAAAREGESERIGAALARVSFPLDRAPLLRGFLVARDERDHVLFVQTHHIVGDDWSTWVLAHDLAALYAAEAAGRPAALPALAAQFPDYAARQRAWLEGEEAREQIAGWRRDLAGLPEAIDLPFDRPRSPVRSLLGEQIAVPVAPGDVQALLGVALRGEATLFMALLTVLDVLLYRYSGQPDLAVGVQTANRNHAGAQGLIGYFTNTLVLRAELRGPSTFRESLARTRESMLAAIGRQDVPFDSLVRELGTAPSLVHAPLAQVFLSFQNTPPLPAELGPGLGLKVRELGNGTSRVDLTLFLRQEGEALVTVWEYASALFDPATVRRMAGHFQVLLAAAAADPERRIADLPLLTGEEREQLLVGFNDTGSTAGPDVCLHQLFEASAARVPEQVALIAPDARLTYRELDVRAERLAKRLRSLGLGPEQLAGVLMDRTADLIVALLAIQKAGGAYAPLDPNYPKQRVRLMLETARATVLVTRRHLVEDLPAGMPTVFLDPGWESEPVEAELPAVLPQNLAYVIFTSGSTGAPKGVAIQHRSAVAMVRWCLGMYSPEEYAGVLVSTSICFDMSVFEIFATLAAGGRLILAENALALPELAAKDEVVLVDTVPSAMAELLRSGRLPSTIRTVNLGGEPLKASLVREIYEQLPSVERVVNLYGPSEDTTFTSWAVVPRATDHPLIGWALTGEQAYVLDREMRPVPVGVPGALYMGGEGVTRGYLHRPDLTAERYVPNLYGPPGSRLYAVGDLVRYLPTGELDYLGRLDHQVKVRGFRIELGEIEATLTRHPEVREAAVLATPDVLSGNRLLAFLETERDLPVADLRAHLKQSLPDYMVPSIFVQLRELPLTPNGKIDRRTLAAMPVATESVEEGRGPRGYAEEVLAGLWSDLFGRAVGVEENFFDLGGHSLLATRLVSRIREAFGIELPLRRVFEQPTLAGLARSVEAALGVGGALEAPRIEPIPRTGPLPLSFAQRRLWFLDQLSPGSAVYNIPVPLDLEGPLETGRLAAALTALVARQESLRTTFPSVDGEPVQAIAPPSPFPLPVMDLDGLPAAAALIRQESLRPFDLATGPLFRATLLRLGAERHILLLNMHHAVSDGWSIEILLRELSALYEGRSLPELPVQYADFAVWQRQWLSGEALSRQLDHWRGRLAGAPAGLDMPTDFPRPVMQTFNGSTRSVELPVEALRELCRREGVTLFMLLLAAFDTLLSRYSGQEDVLVGSPVAGRNRAETEGLIGFFVNTLVLRIDLGTAVSFRDLLRQARETALAVYSHQDLPFETLVEELKPQRDLSRSPFFQVLLSLENHAAQPEVMGGARLSRIELEYESAKFDLSLFASDSPSGLRLVAEYNTDLYVGTTIQRLLGHLGRLLAAAVANPGQGWRDLPLLADEEREQLLVGFNDTGATAGPDVCLHQLFEAQAARIPDRTALIAPDARLTYRELDARAERLAKRLRSLGLGPERLAGVLMDRTADLIVALLAIQKAGGAYAPLDPNYPKQRVKLMLETARATVLVTRRHLAEDLPAEMTTVFLDPGWESEPVEAELPAVLPENLAYVIFTSGSTGAPKGVAIQHRSAVSMVRWCLGMYSPEEYAGVLVSTSICFDMSVFEIFATLAAGGRLILAENALALPELAAKDEVVLVDTVPSAMAELLRSGRLPSTIRTVNLGGEPLKASLVREIYEQLPGVERVVNLYGPSEDTTFTSYAVVPRDTDHPLIGWILTGEQAYVLDREMRPVPIGVPGALYMGGEGVTRGYLHRPDLTAERYVPNPYGPPGSRLYTVGDLVRYLPTGELDYLGRLDHQVKVRGFRIELGEIEAALTRHPEVREAAVLATPDVLSGNRLIAYVETERDLPVADLRAHLKQTLPDYMVPSIFVQLRELPLTPNGKIDRRSLAAMPFATESVEEGRGPSGHAEEVLAGIWSDLFGRAVGVEENFFDLGGHSLLATRLVSRIREAFGIELPLRRIFEQPTIAGLARSVDAALEAGGAPEEPHVEPVPPSSLPLSFAQRRLWFLDQLSPGSAVYNIPVPLSLEGPLEIGRLAAVLTGLVERHEALRTTFPSVDGEPVQEIAPAGPFPLPVVDLSGLPEPARSAQASVLTDREPLRPFDLGTGPLFRATLLRLDAGRHILLLDMHHIVSDGWSIGILLRELSALYEDRPLPELPVQYADFAIWQRQWLSGETLSRQLDYWRVQLAGAPAGLDLPTDFPRPAVQTFNGSTCSAELPGEDLRAFCRREGVTLFMLLLAAFDALLSRYSGQEDVLVGSPVAGRNRVEIEGLIGFFVNTLVLRVNLGEAASFRDLLRQARETALAAYGHQDLPFETLVEELKPQRDLSRSPFFQVLLSLETSSGELPALGGVRVSELEGAHDSAKFDLSLFVTDAASGLELTAEYNTDLYEGATVQRLLGHLGRLLAAAVADPEQGWRDLPLLTGEEREQLLVGFNDTGATAGPDVCLHQLFEAAAARVPEQVALIAPDARLTYRELDERAERLAKRLRSLGLGPERLAGVLMDRTADLIVALLAIQKAGGAYAPLDPNYPKQRVRLMLETARATLLVTRRHLAEDLPAEMTTVFLDPGWEQEAVEAELPAVLPENLAYVIFTSGSTGAPKGVAIQHRSAVSMVRWCLEMYSAEEYAGVLVSTSICFDMSVFEIFATLAAGGRLILAENALALPELGAKDEVVLVDTVPSAMAELLRSGRLPSTIRTVNLGGEPLKASLVREIYEQLPSVERVVNLYGPSEDTTFSSWAVVPRDTDHPLIGWALTGEQAYVLDREMRPVPIGVPGALYMGGEGVTRGYLHRPDLTAERYVPNPYGPPGSRLYTVGDLVRYMPTGELDYLGRLDHQVKVRGFRIELGEIEATLTRHPEVREAAVLATPDVLSGNRLLAFLETERDLPVADLRAHLKQSLPDYMVPSIFVQLRGLPLTPNGKIDRRALAAMPLATESVEEGRGPRGYAEEVLAGIWSDLFGRAVGVEENFFDLGGHSLLATRVASRIREAFGTELPLRRIFEQPTIAGLARSVEAALGVGGALEAPRIEPVPRTGPLPLSFAQRRLWFLDQLSPGSAVYNIPAPLSLEGPLEIGRLAAALTALVARHEALRTTFPSVDGEPVQAIAPPGPFPLPVVDLDGLPAAAALIRQESLRPFDLGTGPLFRATLLRLGAERHILLLNMHHVVSDGWSIEILLRELSALYEGRSLPELPVQYADFAVWQRRWLSGEALSRQLDYWRGRLAGAPAALELPTDFPRPAVQTFHGSTREVELPVEALRELCRREGVTLFMLLLAAFDALLARYSGQEDVLVGSPVAGRNRAETEGLIGFFVNTLVLRMDVGAAVSFRGLLGQARETALAAYAHQDLPFETLVEELKPQRDLSRSPFFQVSLSLQNLAAELPPLGGVRVSFVEGDHESSKFDLSLFAGDSPAGLRLVVEYNTDLYEAATIERLLGHLGTLLAAATAEPAGRLSELPLLGEEERRQLLGWSGSSGAWPRGLTLQSMLAGQAARTPELTAVSAEEGSLTYAEMDERSNQLARRLRRLGVGRESLVGLCLERSLEMVVAIYGVLKAGGAYVPLDPEYPAERLALMFADSGIRAVLTQERLLPVLPEPRPESVLCLDSGWPGIATESGEPLNEEGAGEESLAYVIFTSGSTGRPKGAAIPQRAIVNHMLWMQQEYPLAPGDRVLQKTPFSFDASIWEFHAPLLSGATLVMARPGGQREPAYLIRAIQDHGITILQAVPALLRALLDEEGFGDCRSLRRVFCGGEALTADVQGDFFATLGSELVNLYGPTETAVEILSWRCDPARSDRPALLGWPITNSRVHVLGPEGDLCPAGVPGEICIGGAPVGRGYLARPAETAVRFVPDPFGEPGARLYRSGDLGRRLAGGALEFLGRIDHQVKVRGFRIEPGEVEAALLRHPEIREAAVLAVPDVLGGNRLVAYVETGKDLPVAELRTHLAPSLPDYMVPSVFAQLRSLPLAPSGKIDRRALAALPVGTEEGGEEKGRAPRGYVEEVLAGIWSDVFGRPVGVEESFFDLGGHSLLATRVVARIRASLDVELPLQQLFAAPTVAGLAAFIEREMAERRTVSLPPIGHASREGLLPLSFGQQRLWFLDRLETGTAAFNLPSPLRLRGRLDPGALSRALDEIVRRHESLRTVFGEHEGRGCQEVRPPAPVPLPLVDLSGLPEPAREAEARRQAEREARRPFDLARGPLFRAVLVKLDALDGLLLVTMHHIVTDGFSTNLFSAELRTLYAAFAAGLPSPLPELPLQYPDFAVWQREVLDGPAVEALLEDWTRRFGTAAPPLQLPTDRPRPRIQTFPGALRTLRIDPETSRQIRRLAQRSGVTLFMALLGAFQALLHRWSGQERILVGSPVAGRSRPELEGMIGFFVNTLVFPSDLPDGLTVAQLLERSRETALGVYASQDLPFERLVEVLQPVRDNSRSPVFQAMFLLHHEPPAVAETGEGGIRFEPYDTGTGTSQFDLTLFASDGPEGILTGVEYNTDLFDAATLDRFLEQYRDLLAAAADSPEARLAEILPAAPEERAVPAAPEPDLKPVGAAVEERRDRLSSRLSSLSPAQREALRKRLKGGGTP